MNKVKARRNKFFSVILVICMVLSLAPIGAVTTFAADDGLTAPSAGNGTADSPYEIRTANELYWFVDYVNTYTLYGQLNTHAILKEDIVINPGDPSSYNGTDTHSYRQWVPMGKDNAPYNGIFDGNNKTISGLFYDNDDPLSYASGLFAYNSGIIKNVNIVKSYINGYNYVGGICGSVADSGEILNCSYSGSVSGMSYVGGICGQLDKTGNIENCFNNAAVTGVDICVGGICGHLANGTISYCYSTGIITEKNDPNTAGITGYKLEGTMIYCYYLDTSATCGINANAYGQWANKSIDREAERTTAARFASGEITWRLNGSVNPEDTDTPAWYQNLSEDAYPTLNDTRGRVYECEALSCDGSHFEPARYGYSNSKGTLVAHNYVNGLCSICGEYEPPTLNNNETTDILTDDYYEINNTGNFCWFRNQVNSGNSAINGKLMANIDLSSVCSKDKGNWAPIGNAANIYTGTFDGNGFSVSDMYVKVTTATENIGLFGYIKNSNIKNITVSGDITLSSEIPSSIGCFGGIVGLAEDVTTIENCTNEVNINASATVMLKYIGGVVGRTTSTTEDKLITVSKCINTGSITLGSTNVDCAGGINGYSSGALLIDKCINAGKITSTYSSASLQIGGILGYINQPSFRGVRNCLNTGTITVKSGYSSKTGGIIGVLNGNSPRAGVFNNYYNNEKYSAGIGTNKGSGTISSTAYVSKTDSHVGSGEVAYLLNNRVTDGTQDFYQNINNGKKDSYPKFSGGTVYPISDYYSNSPDICGIDNSHVYFDFANNYIFTDSLGITSLDSLLISGTSVTLGGTKSNGAAWGTGSTVKQSKNGTDTDYMLIVKGDLDGDSVCDVLDCFAVEKTQSGSLTPSQNQRLAADSDSNETIDINDYQQIVNKAVA